MTRLKGTTGKIRDIIESNGRAMDARSIKRSLDHDVNTSTVYRSLKRLEELYLVNTIFFPDGTKYYFSGKKDGHFIMCEHCHEVLEFNRCGGGQIHDIIRKEYDYEVKGHVMIILGICPDCRKVLEKQSERM